MKKYKVLLLASLVGFAFLVFAIPSSGFACQRLYEEHRFSDFFMWGFADVIVQGELESFDPVTYENPGLILNKETKKHERGMRSEYLGVITFKSLSVLKGDLPANTKKVYWRHANYKSVPKSETEFLGKYGKEVLIALEIPARNERLKEIYAGREEKFWEFTAEDKKVHDLEGLAELHWVHQPPCSAALVLPYNLWNYINVHLLFVLSALLFILFIFLAINSLKKIRARQRNEKV